MSQVCTIVTEVRDLGDVKEACKALGWKFVADGGHLRSYESQQGRRCTVLVEFPESVVDRKGTPLNWKYNLGLVPKDYGTGYTLLHDNAMMGREVLDAERMDPETALLVGKFKQAVAIAAVMRQTARKRQQVQKTLMADGTVRLDIIVRR